MNVFELVGKIVIDSDGAKQEIDETTKTAKKSHTELTENLKKAGKVVMGTTVAVGTALYAITQETMEYRMQMGQLTTAFTTQGHSAEEAKRTYTSLIGVLGDSGKATEAALHIAKVAESEEDLKTWTEICTGVFATFGDSLPIESLTESANETANVGTVTGTLADALNWAGISEDDFNEKLAACTSVQERQDLIMNTLIGTYGDAAKQYRETNKDVIDANEAHADLNDAMADVGAAAQPAVNMIVSACAELARVAVPYVKQLSDAILTMGNNWTTSKNQMAEKIVASVQINTIRNNPTTSTAQQMGWSDQQINAAVMGGEIVPDGSHASGLDYVPRDNYLANLHKGEAVLTRSEAEVWRNGDDDIRELAATMKQMVNDLPRMMVEAFAAVRVDVNNREFARLVKAVT